MQLHIGWRRLHVTRMLCRHIEGRLRFVPSRFGPREATSDFYGPRLDPDRRQLEIKSWVQLHHLELMKSYGRSVARSITKSTATVTSRVTPHLVTGYS
jgi:hypothetical protein